MTLTQRELAKRDEFAQEYRDGQMAVMQKIERAVCGCDYGSTAWTTRDEADRIVEMLGLAPGVHLLEIGAGAGWPSLYMAQASGCDVTLSDLPVVALEAAMARARRDGLATRTGAVAADAAHLPFPDQCFDAVNHSDVLCCLVAKRRALAECRRVIRPAGRMAFSVLLIPPGLSAEDHAEALVTAPEFIETDTDYLTLLDQTGWDLIEHKELTDEFLASCRKRLEVEERLKNDLLAVSDARAVEATQTKFRRRMPVLARGHMRRELFLAVPRR